MVPKRLLRSAIVELLRCSTLNVDIYGPFRHQHERIFKTVGTLDISCNDFHFSNHGTFKDIQDINPGTIRDYQETKS